MTPTMSATLDFWAGADMMAIVDRRAIFLWINVEGGGKLVED